MQVHVLIVLLSWVAVEKIRLPASAEALQQPAAGRDSWGSATNRSAHGVSQETKPYWDLKLEPVIGPEVQPPTPDVTAEPLPPTPPGTVLLKNTKGVPLTLMCGDVTPQRFADDAKSKIQYVWDIYVYRMSSSKPTFFIVKNVLADHSVELRPKVALNQTTFALELLDPQGRNIDARCLSQKLPYGQPIIHTNYRITLEMPPPPPPTIAVATTPAPPTFAPKVVTLVDGVMLPRTTKEPVVIPESGFMSKPIEVGEFSTKVLNCGNLTSKRLATEFQLRQYEWQIMVYFKDESKAVETYNLNYHNVADNTTLKNMFKIDNATFTLTLLDTKQMAYRATCVRIKSQTSLEFRTIDSYLVTVKEALVTTTTSPCGGKVYIFGQPWCMTITFKGITFGGTTLMKSGTTEYGYNSLGDKEDGPRADHAASINRNSSCILVTFDSLKKDDLTVWTCTIVDGNNSKSAMLDLGNLTVLEPEVEVSAHLATGYVDNTLILNKPWEAVLALGGAAFTKVEASLAGSVVYSSTSGGEEGGSRADAASAAYNSSTRVLTVTFDKFEEGDAALWSFDFGTGTPVELDLTGASFLADVVKVMALTSFDGEFVRYEQWSLVATCSCAEGAEPELGAIQLVQYRKVVFLFAPNGTTGGDRCSKTRLKIHNSTTVVIALEQFLPEDETSWTVILFLKDGSRYAMGTIDLTTAPLKRVCPHAPVISGPIFNIPDRSLRASSFYSNSYAPHRSRLECRDERKDAPCVWCSREPRRPEEVMYLQADLGRIVKVMKVATGGLPKGSTYWITKYKLAYSVDGADYTEDDNNKQNYAANYDQETIVNNTLFKPFFARYVRLIVVEYHRHQCGRWEIYACVSDDDFSKLSIYTPEPPLGFTMDPPTPETRVRSSYCGGITMLRPPREGKHDSLCRQVCKSIYGSCRSICNSWWDPNDRRECEARCGGDACACGRRCTYKRPNHRVRPDGLPQLPHTGAGMSRLGHIGGLDDGLGGILGMGGFGGTDDPMMN